MKALILVGAPTRMILTNQKPLNVLKRLKRMGYLAQTMAIFDIYGPLPKNPGELGKVKKWIYPGAAGTMQKVATTMQLKRLSP